MRRLALVFLLIWLPLHWSFAAVQLPAGHAHGQAHAAAASASPGLPGGADTPDGGPQAQPQDECPQCQADDAGDWQAALPAGLPIPVAEEARPDFDYTLHCESFVPPVPEPPARPAAA